MRGSRMVRGILDISQRRMRSQVELSDWDGGGRVGLAKFYRLSSG